MDEPEVTMTEPSAPAPLPSEAAEAPLPGYHPLSRQQMQHLALAAQVAVMQARAQIAERALSEPLPSIEGDLSALAIRALQPLRDVCVTLPPESAQLVGVLVGQALLVEALRGDLAGVRQIAAAVHRASAPSRPEA